MTRRTARRVPLAGLAILAVIASLISLAIGPAPISLTDLLAAATSWGEAHSSSSMARAVFFDVRLPRVALGLAAGAALSVSGALMQAIFRNPLAEPALVGVSSGAALGAAIAIVMGSTWALPEALRPLAVPLCAAVGAGAVTLLVQRLARSGGQTATATLLLAGLAITSLVNALLGLALYVADDAQLRNLTFWLLGSLGGAQPTHVWVAVPIIVTPVVIALRFASPLDALLLGEAEAGHLGVNVERLKRRVIGISALMVGASVAMCGVIGFVGLLVPHLVRLALGPGHRALLPRAALGGASLLVFADLFARTLVSPGELPIGVLTALVGAPFFLWLLLRGRGRLAP